MTQTNTPLVGIVMGSDSDWPIMKAAAETLKSFGIAYEAKVLSAHRTPDAANSLVVILVAVGQPDKRHVPAMLKIQAHSGYRWFCNQDSY